jgi:hypothetical protein
VYLIKKACANAQAFLIPKSLDSGMAYLRTGAGGAAGAP